MVSLRCYFNQVAAECLDVLLLFLPRDYDVQFGADCRVVPLLPRAYYVEDIMGGYVEVDLDQCLPVTTYQNVLPLNHGGALPKSLRCAY